MQGDSDHLTRALEQREIAIERKINGARLVVILTAGLADAGLAFSNRDTGLAVTILLGAGFFLAWVIAIFWLTNTRTYRAWLKFVAVFMDVLLVLTVYYGYIDTSMAGHMDQLATTCIATLVVANVACGLRVGKGVLVWSTATTLAGIMIIEVHTQMNAAGAAYLVGLDVVAGVLAWWISRGAHQLFVVLRRRDALSRFVPADMIDRLDKGEIDLVPGGESRNVTILMSDIRGFTTLSEENPPMAVVTLLNRFFAEMTEVIFKNGGSIDKFIGDAILAVWGVPEARPDDAERAVKAALEMQHALRKLNGQLALEDLPQLRIGVGVHSGTVVAGQIGAPKRMDFTVIGDAVNVSSRIEGLTKEYGAAVLVSEATRALLTKQDRLEEVAEAEIRGRKKHIRLFKPRVSGFS
jgi:class 3 adenylate cyclase